MHAGEIDVLAWSWGLANAGSSQPGTAGKVNVQDLSFTKWVDKASPKLMLGVCNGKHFPEAVLTLRKAGDRPFEFLKITLSEVVVSSVSTGGSGGEDRLTENVTLRFSKVKVEYTVQKPDGTKGEVVTFGWDLAGNVALP
ncbi:MAG TPA: type VI secretion system tube protein Hcp [Clostridia bacterium]|nr:type VI secretion system tube protein Hcp [Clostridia bacterium]